MSETTASLRRKISSAGDLQSVVRTMKALAASSIGQYEKSVRALGDYYRTVELGLGVCFRKSGAEPRSPKRKDHPMRSAVGAIVFGSDQGLVGQFNDIVADYAIKTLAALPGKTASLGRRRARSCAPDGRGPAASRALHGAEFRPRPSRRSSGRFRLTAKRIEPTASIANF